MERGQFMCDICSKEFNRNYNVLKHKRLVHKCDPVVRGTLKCPACEYSFRFMKTLREHVGAEHHVALETEHHVFESFDEFSNWKIRVEQEIQHSYVLHQGSRTYSTGAQAATYVCHRSGFYNSRSTGKRHSKLGSKRINGFCPSAMNVVSMGSLIDVRFHKTHFGHETILLHRVVYESAMEVPDIALCVQLTSEPPRRRKASVKTKLSVLKLKMELIERTFQGSDGDSAIIEAMNKVNEEMDYLLSLKDKNVSQFTASQSETSDKAMEPEMRCKPKRRRGSNPFLSLPKSPPIERVAAAKDPKALKIRKDTLHVHTGFDHVY